MVDRKERAKASAALALFSELCVVALFLLTSQGVTETGQPFLLPLTLTGNPNSEGWEKSLQSGIAKGKQGWVSRETDKQQKRFKIYCMRPAHPHSQGRLDLISA